MADPAIQKFILRALLSLPRPILRTLAGGGVTHVGGRTLDPRFQYLAAQASKAPQMSAFPADVARAGIAQSLAPMQGAPEPGVRIESLSLPGAEGEVPARAYHPKDQDPGAPLMVYAHFGGGVIGDLDTCEVFCTILAAVARCVVLSVEYRLAPEHRFPAGLDDMLAAYRWARENTARFGAPAGKVAVGGDSMGGNFSAIIAQEMKRAGEPQPTVQLLIYPAMDVASDSPSMTTYANAYPLSRATMQWFMGHYMGPGDSPTNPRLSPGREDDLSGLAPAVIATAGFDPLLDQGEDYARRLRLAGVPTVYRCYDHLAHGFTAFTGAIPAADAACREIARLTRDAFASAPV
jgi:acetyl esterase/lipase